APLQLVHVIQHHMERNPSHVPAKLDFQNGFNSLHRSVMLQNLYSHPSLSILWKLSHWLYHSPSSLVVVDDTGVVDQIPSQRGAVKDVCSAHCSFVLG